ncbi:SpoIIE family protein phosphatase [uncultured Treponema sp.]|uniref:SpoIIE family protein phosphatase n=1 Tax=uncultured Treponema sp. TaxID=162155 RepID=UPI0025DC59B8|nr:SpoIIE family protein phosphatase [uncultured Treponema sp.]
MRHKAKYVRILIFLSLVSIFFCSCGPEVGKKIELGDRFYYWECTAESSPQDAMMNAVRFKKLEDKSIENLKHVLGDGTHFVWVRAEFEIPPEFRNQPLGMVVPHLKFAEQVYLNKVFISQYGAFPPNEQSTLFKAHFFSFPVNILNQEGTNTVLIKIYAQGKSGISSHSFITLSRFAYPSFEIINFHHTRVYIFLVGFLIFTFVLYISFYLSQRVFKEFRDFALVNIFTSIFLIPFFATELPLYTSGLIPFTLFYKLMMCIPAYLIIYFATLFAQDFQHAKFPKVIEVFRIVILSVQIISTILAPRYTSLIKIAPFMLALLGIQGLIGAVYVVLGIKNSERRKPAIQFSVSFLPFTFSILFDLLIRIHDDTQTYPYYSLFGWLFVIAIFIIILAMRFSHLYKRNERLSNHLLEEVSKRTHELEDANYELSILNERLEKEKHRSDMDLEMASLVQRNFLPQPNMHFKGWEIAIWYNPQAKVSGDLYDYYNFNDTLNGFSLFDVSGHGLSASLVTMLSKNIIGHLFQQGFRNKVPLDKILTKINNQILAEKGEIDNYMTGVICRFTDIENSDKCKVELGNAGHPYPLKFSVEDNEIFELMGNDGKKHYGAIGMNGITVSFAKSNFVMSAGDILVCYTDGITEASNSKFEQFGLSQLRQIVKQNHEKSSNEILQLIMDSLYKFINDKPLEDDITLVIAKRTNVSNYIEHNEHDDDFDDTIEELEVLDE